MKEGEHYEREFTHTHTENELGNPLDHWNIKHQLNRSSMDKHNPIFSPRGNWTLLKKKKAKDGWNIGYFGATIVWHEKCIF